MGSTILAFFFTACTSPSPATSAPASEVVDTGSTSDTADTDTAGDTDTALGDTAEGTPLDVRSVEMEECVGDTGGSGCNGERMWISAEDLGADGVQIEDIGVYVACGSVKVSARAIASDIEVTYTVQSDADCSCMHIVAYRIHDLAPGEWKITAREHHTRFTVGGADTAAP